MKIVKMNLILNEDFTTKLVKEPAIDYPVKDIIESEEEIVHIMNEVFGLGKKAEEYLYLIAVTGSGIPIGFFEVAHGTSCNAPVGIRELFIRLLQCAATDFILVHNHPGGAVTPSDSDMETTKRVKREAKLMGFTFLDHIILTEKQFFSFRRAKLLD